MSSAAPGSESAERPVGVVGIVVVALGCAVPDVLRPDQRGGGGVRRDPRRPVREVTGCDAIAAQPKPAPNVAPEGRCARLRSA
jgi:hypothetical protein